MCGDVATGALEGVFKVYLRCVVESWFFRVCSEGVCIAPPRSYCFTDCGVAYA